MSTLLRPSSSLRLHAGVGRCDRVRADSGGVDARLARRLQVTDQVPRIAAGALLVVGSLRVFFFERGSGYSLAQPRLHGRVFPLHRVRPALDHPDGGVHCPGAEALGAGQVPVVPARSCALVAVIHSGGLPASFIILLFAAVMRGVSWVQQKQADGWRR